jgi:transcription elongation factor GreA
MPVDETTEVLLTQEGYELKKKELDDARRMLHEEIPQRLKIAKEHGGELRENKEFIDIQTEKEFYEAKVRQLEDLLDRAKIIDESQISTKQVGIGSWIKLKRAGSNEEMKFELVSQAEVNLETNKISIDSPLGKALLGHKRGDEIELVAPKGRKITYKILDIRRG